MQAVTRAQDMRRHLMIETLKTVGSTAAWLLGEDGEEIIVVAMEVALGTLPGHGESNQGEKEKNKD